MEGYIKLYRQLRGKGFYRNSKYVHLWVHLLLKANHGETELLWDGGVVRLVPGQFITGRKELSKETGIRETTIEDILKLFENQHQIRQQTYSKFRIITIENWEEYQGFDKIRQQNRQQSDNRATTERQQSDTNNNDKNDNNEKNNSKELGPPVSYGNEDINKVISFLKEKLGGTPDGSQKENRMYASNLLKRIKKDYPDQSAPDVVCQMIELGLQDSFHAKNLTSFKYLFYNAQKIVQTTKVRISNPKVIKI